MAMNSNNNNNDDGGRSNRGSLKSESTTFLMENMEEIKRVFNRFDTNGDGKISPTDLSKVMKSLGSETTEEELKTMMNEIDKDGDGFIDLNEFAEFHRGGSGEGGGSSSSTRGGEISNEDGVRELKDAFDMYDKDKNGLISATELHMVLKGLGDKCSIKDCSRMIKSFDLDGDGSVNFDEFKKMMTNNKD